MKKKIMFLRLDEFVYIVIKYCRDEIHNVEKGFWGAIRARHPR